MENKTTNIMKLYIKVVVILFALFTFKIKLVLIAHFLWKTHYLNYSRKKKTTYKWSCTKRQWYFLRCFGWHCIFYIRLQLSNDQSTTISLTCRATFYATLVKIDGELVAIRRICHWRSTNLIVSKVRGSFVLIKELVLSRKLALFFRSEWTTTNRSTE